MEVSTAATTSTSARESSEWHFLQCFGERSPGEDVQEADIISAVEFNHDGRHLATGDRGGRVVLFEQAEAQPRMADIDERPQPPGKFSNLEYRYLTEFQSHDPEFDYLKSLEIEEKINQVKWVDRNSQSSFILSTNDKTIKLWRIYDRLVTEVASPTGMSSEDDWTIPAGVNAKVTISPSKKVDSMKWEPVIEAASPAPGAQLQLPQVVCRSTVPAARLSKMYQNAHTYHVNSISMSSDQETFMSADDLRINLWHLEVTDCAFNVLDLKPANMEDLTEVITCAEFHPQHCHLFAYSCSKGGIRLADMRAQALCDQHVKEFDTFYDPKVERCAYSEIISSISDMKFSHDGRHILSRDYMTVKLWDINMESKPVAVFPVHDHLRSKFADLYESNGMFDKFNLCMSGDGTQIASGTYGNQMRIVKQDKAWPEKTDTLLEASRDPLRRRHNFAPRTPSRFGLTRNPIKRPSTLQNGAIDVDSIDFSTKLLHLAWNPEINILAAAASNSLYLFCQQ